MIDHAVAFCGGINIVDDYTQGSATLPFPRWDFAVEMAGPAVADVRAAFELQWHRIQFGHKPYAQYAAGCTAAKRSPTCSGAGCAAIDGSRPAHCGS